LTSSIIPKDKKSETICDAIVETINDKATHLDKWAVIHEKMFGHTHSIPSSSQINLSKLEGGLVNTDTCNGACLLAKLLVDAVDFAVEEKRALSGDDGNNPNTIATMVQDCHNDMCNIWIKAVTHQLTSYLNKVLADDLNDVDWRLRITTVFDGILRAVDKEFSLPANYPKGHGDMFKHWLLKFHPGAVLVPVTHTTGSRQDLATEGAAAVYWNRRYYVEFLDECLRGCNDNILQENLFIVLTFNANGGAVTNHGNSSFQNLYAAAMASW